MPVSDLNFSDIIKDMTAAAKEVLSAHWKDVKPFAELQVKTFAQNVKLIGELKLKGLINEEKAKLQLAIQRDSVRTVLIAFEGIGLVAAENAINAAISVVRTAINKAIGWTLL